MIRENANKILKSLPEGVSLVAAAKQRSASEIEEAISAGVSIIGENYIQEARRKFDILGNKVKWHFIGHLQKNKIKPAAVIFDMIETIDSIELAKFLDDECERIKKVMPILIEVNSAAESQKTGVIPERVEELIDKVSGLKNIRLSGLMTMGPWLSDQEALRPYFKKTKELFDKISNRLSDKNSWKYLSMGMSSSYITATQEGATMVRVGEAIFGPRKKKNS
jgi:PLP dependent protein